MKIPLLSVTALSERKPAPAGSSDNCYAYEHDKKEHPIFQSVAYSFVIRTRPDDRPVFAGCGAGYDGRTAVLWQASV
jgi:hypothetical protein